LQLKYTPAAWSSKAAFEDNSLIAPHLKALLDIIEGDPRRRPCTREKRVMNEKVVDCIIKKRRLTGRTSCPTHLCATYVVYEDTILMSHLSLE
jgi:hypothetical protein